MHPDNEWSARLWWAVPAGVVLVLLLLVMVFGPTPQPLKHGTSYDASPEGFRAAYLLLDELGYPVARSKRPVGGAVRWVLFPNAAAKEAQKPLSSWVQGGGIVVLADATGEFARQQGWPVEREPSEATATEEAASGPGVTRLAAGKVRLQWTGPPGRVWATAGDQPMVTIHSWGRGEVWLVHRPEFLTNRFLGQADNAVLLCRLASAGLQGRAGQLTFDEYCHGLRERPGVTALLLQPPMLWVTLQGLLLLGVLLWQLGPRFGALRPVPLPSRRSKEEFLHSLAALLEQKGDYADALATVRADFVHALERDLGLPAGTPREQLIEEALRRRPIHRERLQPLLAQPAPPVRTAAAFVQALHELEAARHEFFHGRHHR